MSGAALGLTGFEELRSERYSHMWGEIPMHLPAELAGTEAVQVLRSQPARLLRCALLMSRSLTSIPNAQACSNPPEKRSQALLDSAWTS